MLWQITQQLLRTIERQHTDTINHYININQLRNACLAARLRRLAPQLYIDSTRPQNPGVASIMTQAMNIPQHIQTATYTYGHQIAPPPSKSLFFGMLMHDATSPTGVIMYPKRYSTEAYLPEYHPLHSMFDRHTKKE